MYLFTWATPVMDGKLKSCHTLELPFMWDAIDQPGLAMLTGDGPERQAIADAMHAAWIAFARTGDPGWPQYDLDRRATKRFDTTTEVLDDPMGDERALWDAVARPSPLLGTLNRSWPVQRAENGVGGYWMTEPPSTARA